MGHFLAKVLIVEHRRDWVDALVGALANERFEFVAVEEFPAVMKLPRPNRCDVIIVSMDMPGRSGIEMVRSLKTWDPHAEIVVATGGGTNVEALAWVKEGVYDCICRPYQPEEVRALLQRILEKKYTEGLVSIYEVNNVLLGASDEGDLVGQVAGLARHVLGAEAAGLILFPKRDCEGCEKVYTDGAPSAPSEDLVRGLLKRVCCARGESVAIPARTVVKAGEGDCDALAKEGFAQAAIHPLIIRKNQLGALVLLRSLCQPAFTLSDLRRGTAFATELALVLHNVNLHAGLAFAEARARASEARLGAILNAAQDAVLMMDGEGCVRDMNSAATRIFGWALEEIRGKRLSELILPERYRADHEKCLSEANRPGKGKFLGQGRELMAQRRNGEEFPVELTVSAVKDEDGSIFSACVRDMSETRRLEVERRHAHNLEAVGQLAAGIAHEINTPVQFIGDSAHFLKSAFGSLNALIGEYRRVVDEKLDETEKTRMAALEDDADLVYLLEQIPKAIDRTVDGTGKVATIVRAMKNFAHPGRPEKVAADLNQAIQDTLTVARNELKYVADVETDLGELPPVPCHPGDMNQVFLNLLLNAAHAIGDVVKGTDQKGKIRVSTRRVDDSVIIEVSDTGTGIPEAIRGRIFEPFFTTKDVGRGLGQGLAVVRSIVVDKHGGTLTLATEVGKGTSFSIALPLSQVRNEANPLRR